MTAPELLLAHFRQRLPTTTLRTRVGRVLRCQGLVVEVRGLEAFIGEACCIRARAGALSIPAEVVGFQEDRLLLMPLGDIQGLDSRAWIEASGRPVQARVGNGMVGRVLNALGEPLDGYGPVGGCRERPLYAGSMNPLERQPIDTVFETGVRVIDGCLTIGEGQRVGLFAGSGVGKSTVLSMLARHGQADVNVIVMVGERGREVPEFLQDTLGEEGLRNSVVVVATADEHPLVRRRAAYQGSLLARHFAEQGKRVMLAMDSVTRFAMACREIGLALGEIPASRGYTPSALAELPRLVEMAGRFRHAGSVTGLYTVLVEGDDFNEPVADACRAILDGHLVLSRELAQVGHYPAVDVPASNSRLAHRLTTSAEQALALEARALLAEYARNESMLQMGLYQTGSNRRLDKAVRVREHLLEFLRQGAAEHTPRLQAVRRLDNALSDAA